MDAAYRDPGEKGLLRLFYRRWRPTRFGRMFTHALAWVAGLGILPPVLVKLQVRGRSSGLIRTSVVVVTHYRGEPYLVSMLGDQSDWVRNVRAAGGEAIVKRGRAQRVRLVEVPAGDRAPILKAYCQVATSGRKHFPVPHDAPVAEFAAVAGRYPVFRIEPS